MEIPFSLLITVVTKKKVSNRKATSAIELVLTSGVSRLVAIGSVYQIIHHLPKSHAKRNNKRYVKTVFSCDPICKLHR
jgi:hypothetical protein